MTSRAENNASSQIKRKRGETKYYAIHNRYISSEQLFEEQIYMICLDNLMYKLL